MIAGPVEIHALALGPLETNCYILQAGGECWVVDPGWPEPLMEHLAGHRLAPSRILLTHGHGDHIIACADVKREYPQSRLCCPAADAAMIGDPVLNVTAAFGMPMAAPPPDELLAPGQTLELGPTQWQVLDTSGHTKGGVSYYCPEAGVVLTGDALFAGSIGRTDIPGASPSRLLRNIRTHLLTLPPRTIVLAGHGQETTIENERTYNTFFAGK